MIALNLALLELTAITLNVSTALLLAQTVPPLKTALPVAVISP
jgi:hypothetical protein